jgi:MFS family permease
VGCIAFSFLTMCLIGVGLVGVSWVAANHGTIALVGQLFFISGVTNIFVSAVGGVLVDRRSRRGMVLRGQAMRLLGTTVLFVGIQYPAWLTFALFASTILNTAGPASGGGAMAGVFQTLFPPEQRMRINMRLGVVGQVGFVAGTGISGIVLHLWGAEVCVGLMVVIAGVLLILGEYFTRDMTEAPLPTGNSFSADWREGLRYALADWRLAGAILGVALLVSVAQMTNTLVPGFVRDTLHAGSDVFGLLEAVWSAGGGSALAAAAFLRQQSSYRGWVEFAMLAVLGLVMVGFALSRSVSVAVALYAIMGALFALSRAVCSGRILILADPAYIGRVLALTSMLTSGTGMVIYIMPTFVLIADIALYYQAWGIAILVVGLGLAAASWRAERHALVAISPGSADPRTSGRPMRIPPIATSPSAKRRNPPSPRRRSAGRARGWSGPSAPPR